MSLLIGKSYIQYCNSCKWKSPYVLKSDIIPIMNCPKCKYKLTLIPLSDLSIIDIIKYKLTPHH